jgi:hypothetical protein
MEGALPIMFLLVVLKIPVFFAIWLVWWGARSYDEFGEELAGGEEDHGFRRFRRQPKRPKGPRRGGDHGGATANEPPPRTRGPMPAIRPRVTGVTARDRR